MDGEAGEGERTCYRTCPLCEAMCGLEIKVRGRTVTTVRGDTKDPFSRGHLCPKPVALKDIQEDPDRLRGPVRRTADGWEPVSWDEALDAVARRLAEVQAAHGRNAVATYLGNPTVHNHGALLYAQVLLAALRTRNRYSATSVDQLPHMLAALLMFGHQLMIPVPDIDRTHFMLILGANPVVSNGSLMSAPGVKDRLRGIQSRGGRVVVVDPRRTETARLADAHHFIRPGSDALLLLGLLHVLFDEDRVDPGAVSAFTDGLGAVRDLAARFPPERVAPATGVPADAIRELARQFADAESAVAYGRIGVSTQAFGGLACWLVNVLNVVTGNLDRAGGAMFTRPAVDLVGLTTRAGSRGHFDKGRSRVSGLPEFGGEYPSAALAEEMDTPGEGQVRALVTFAGNPVLSTPNGPRLEKALAGLDFMVSIDMYVNETTRHADFILPPTSPLEHDHYDLAFHVLAVRNTAKYSAAVLPAPAGARHDWEILHGLARRLDALNGGGYRARLKHAALARLGPRGLVDLGLRAGPYGVRTRPWNGLSVRKLERAPHGLDLGALTPALPDRLATPNGRIALAPQRFLDDVARLEAAFFPGDAAPSGSLVLVGRRQLRSNNSWMHNSARLVKGKDPCTLLVHPEDARQRGLTSGDRVRVTARAGCVVVPVEVTDEVMPGVVSLPHGWGHDRPGTGQRVAAAHAGASINDVTDEARVDALSGNAAFSGTPVSVALEKEREGA